jgi:GMP synthase-like glutamine amidotransferase
MKIAIIDNGTRFIGELARFAQAGGANEVTTFNLDQIDDASLASCDLVILSGAVRDPVGANPEKYQKEIELVKTTEKPVLGICMGFEIIAYAFGSDLERMHNKESRILSLNWVATSPITECFNSIEVQEHHRWRIKKLGDELMAIAESEDGIEIIKHKDRPIYGFQFHPELNDSVDDSIFQKF